MYYPLVHLFKPFIIHVIIQITIQLDVKVIEIHIRIFHDGITLHLVIILVVFLDVFLNNIINRLCSKVGDDIQIVIFIINHQRFILRYKIEPGCVDIFVIPNR